MHFIPVTGIFQSINWQPTSSEKPGGKMALNHMMDQQVYTNHGATVGKAGRGEDEEQQHGRLAASSLPPARSGLGFCSRGGAPSGDWRVN